MATIAQLATRIDLSERHVKTLIDAGVLEHAASGKHDLDKQTIRYIRHLRDIKRGVEGGGSSKLSDARARVATAHATKAEFEMEAEQGKWCSIEDVVAYVTAEILVIRENLLSVPGKLADPLGAADRIEAYEVLRTEIYDCLGRLASGKAAVEFVIDMVKHGGGNIPVDNDLVEFLEQVCDLRDRARKLPPKNESFDAQKLAGKRQAQEARRPDKIAACICSPSTWSTCARPDCPKKEWVNAHR